MHLYSRMASYKHVYFYTTKTVKAQVRVGAGVEVRVSVRVRVRVKGLGLRVYCHAQSVRSLCQTARASVEPTCTRGVP